MARRFGADAQPIGAEIQLNQSTAGDQAGVSLAGVTGGGLLAAWTSLAASGQGSEIQALELDENGMAVGDAFRATISAPNPGVQTSPTVVVAADRAVIAWAGSGSTDDSGVFARRFMLDVETGPNQVPTISIISDREATVGQELEIAVTASDPNGNDTLTIALDPNSSPASATLMQTSNTTAVIRWTPAAADVPGPVNFRVIATDNGEPPLTGARSFSVTVSAASQAPIVDLNGGQPGLNFSTTFTGTAALLSNNLTITDPTATTLASATVRIVGSTQGPSGGLENPEGPPDGLLETVGVNTSGTSITASYNFATSTLTLSGTASIAQYEQVLRTLAYNNAANPRTPGNRTIEVTVNDGQHTSAVATATVTVS
jgi:hypothetical protein